MPIAELVDWSLALLPVLAMLALFVWLDLFKLMTLKETLALLALGGVVALLAYPVSGRMIDALPLGFSFYSRFVAPWIEEALKTLAIVGLIACNRIGFKLDAVVSGFAVGAGFSVIENILYLTRFPELAAPVWMVRGLGTAVMHGGCTALVAAIAHELGERATRGHAARFRLNPLWFVPGYALAGAAHMGFNQFPDRPLLAMMGALIAAPITLIAILRFGADEAQQWLTQESKSHRAALTELGSGTYPSDESGRRIALLAARCPPAVAGLIHSYVETLMGLVVSAEEILLEQARSAGHVRAAEARTAFERLDWLRSALGRTMFAALEPLLPLSRNDRWELSELRERLTREN